MSARVCRTSVRGPVAWLRPRVSYDGYVPKSDLERDHRRVTLARVRLDLPRAELEDRHCVRVWRKRWYDLHDQVLWDLAKQTKLLVPDVANSNRFAVDRGSFLPLHSVYYVVPKPGVDVDFLAAVLNSSIAGLLVRLFSPVVKDGFNRYRQQFLRTLPVPLASSKQVAEIADAARAGDAEDADRRVQRLFRLTPEDVGVLHATARQVPRCD